MPGCYSSPFVHVRLVVLLVAASGCSPVPMGDAGEGPGRRPQALGLTPEQEYRIGVRAWQEVMAEAKQQNAIVTDPRVVGRVRGIGQRIADVATGNAKMNVLLRREINLRTE